MVQIFLCRPADDGPLPKVIVRVRFSSPALIVKAQATTRVPRLGLDRPRALVDLPCH